MFSRLLRLSIRVRRQLICRPAALGFQVIFIKQRLVRFYRLRIQAALPVGVGFCTVFSELLRKKSDLYKQLIDGFRRLKVAVGVVLRRHVAGLRVCACGQLCTMPGLMLSGFRGKLLGSRQAEAGVDFAGTR
jgi:hypothetical protein